MNLIEKVEKEIEKIISQIKFDGVSPDILLKNSNYSVSLSSLHYLLKKYYLKKNFERIKKYNELYKTIKYHSDYNVKTIREIESLIYDNEEYFNLYAETEKIKNLLEYMENILNILRAREYNLKNIVNMQYEKEEEI